MNLEVSIAAANRAVVDRDVALRAHASGPGPAPKA